MTPSSSMSRAPSFQSDQSDVDMSLWSIGLNSSSPSEHHVQSWDQFRAPERPHTALGGNVRQRYASYKMLDRSDVHQPVSLKRDSDCNKPLPPLRERRELFNTDSMQFDNYHVQRVRASHKKLFGENGWLGCRADVDQLHNDKNKTKLLKDFGKKIIKHVEDFVSTPTRYIYILLVVLFSNFLFQAGDVAKAYPISFSQGSRRPRIVQKTTIPISLDPITQAKLYSDMEVMICVSANKFLVQQHYEGRLSVESIKKITNFWGSKNRPQVVEFQFDQATQRQLILSNIRTLRFNGECSTNPILLNSNLHNWKAIVKEMSVRTFCSPDSVIRKHLHDIQKILDMLGAPLSTFLAFQDLQMRTLALMKENLTRVYRPGSDGSGSSFERTGRQW